ncbi:MAG: peptidoglycan editing factor PgeF [Patescibacteria group bacterium]
MPDNYTNIFPKDRKVIAVFSHRAAGDLKNNRPNQTNFFSQFGIDWDQVVFMNQVHGANVEYADGSRRLIDNTDGIFTDKKNVYLAVNTADCLPIFIINDNPAFVGVIHCGWRSLVNGIIAQFFRQVAERLPLKFERIRATVGPGIQSCHFEIKNDVLDAFQKYQSDISERSGKMFVDLPAIARRCLTEAGLKGYNIKLSEACTYCQNEKYYSFRREREQLNGEMIGFIGLYE